MILSVKDKEGGNHVVFVEAKLSTYKNAAIDILDGYPEFLGNTSKVNVQLALKHRFWKAYQRFNLKTDYVIQEDHVYDRQRKLEKDFVINRYIKEYLDHDAEVYFVALTNDDQATTKSNGNLCQIVMNDHFRPPIKEDYWKADKSRFGLLTYKMLEKLKVVEKKAGYYSKTSEILKTEEAISGCGDLKSLKTIALPIELITEIAKLQKKNDSTKPAVKIMTGSVSIILNNEVIAKVVYQTGGVFSFGWKVKEGQPNEGIFMIADGCMPAHDLIKKWNEDNPNMGDPLCINGSAFQFVKIEQEVVVDHILSWLDCWG